MSAYDEVKRSLVDLSDAYALCATRAGFDRKLVQFMARHEKRDALVRRLADAGLLEEVVAMIEGENEKDSEVHREIPG